MDIEKIKYLAYNEPLIACRRKKVETVPIKGVSDFDKVMEQQMVKYGMPPVDKINKDKQRIELPTLKYAVPPIQIKPVDCDKVDDKYDGNIKRQCFPEAVKYGMPDIKQ